MLFRSTGKIPVGDQQLSHSQYYRGATVEYSFYGCIFPVDAQILVFAFGELLFSPRFSEYVARVAPKDKVASYMSLAALDNEKLKNNHLKIEEQ